MYFFSVAGERRGADEKLAATGLLSKLRSVDGDEEIAASPLPLCFRAAGEMDFPSQR